MIRTPSDTGAPDRTLDGRDQDCDGLDGPDQDGDGYVAASEGAAMTKTPSGDPGTATGRGSS